MLCYVHFCRHSLLSWKLALNTGQTFPPIRLFLRANNKTHFAAPRSLSQGLPPSLPPSPSPGALSFRRTKPTGLTREEGKLEDIGNSCGHNYLPACPARGPGSTLVLKLYSSQVALGKVPHDIENLVCKSTVLLENQFYLSSMACRVFGRHVCILHCC